MPSSNASARLFQEQKLPGTIDYCQDESIASQFGLSDLYCVNLTAIPEIAEASGFVEMRQIETPFGVAVTTEGVHRFQLTATIFNLPEPSTFGEAAAYVAWATTPIFEPVIKLGTVQNGKNDLGEVGLNKFVILISAEKTAEVTERTGKIVLRGTSPSNRMEAHDLGTLSPLAVFAPQSEDHSMHAMHDSAKMSGNWRMPPMHPAIQMAPGMMGIRPKVQPLRLQDGAPENLPQAKPRNTYPVPDGGQFDLDTKLVRRTVKGQEIVMLGFNEEQPGPLLEVPQGATITVNFTNDLPIPSAIHWHGLRLDYRFDGVPGLTQPLIERGQSFFYTLTFPDAGIYWYHPHFREDIGMDMGLYANILVRPRDPAYFSPVNREEMLVLNDILLGSDGVVPHGKESSNFMLMGRFGNTFLINGDPDYKLQLKRGEVVRFFITNSSNTRTYNLSLDNVKMKAVGSDVGKYEREQRVENIVIATAERYIIEAHFEQSGTVAITNRVQAINHQTGSFFPEVDTLGMIEVLPEQAETDFSESFEKLRVNTDVITDIDRYRHQFERSVDKELIIELEVHDLPPVVQQLMRFDRLYFNPVEWSGTMPMMNWASTGEEVRWILRDPATGKENMAIDWRFKVGEVVKIRLINDRNSFHAMQHPIHAHGQRFLVLSRDGVPMKNLVWKDTTILPAGATADILLEISNPGKWMFHCHIAEHIDSGMMFVFEAEE